MRPLVYIPLLGAALLAVLATGVSLVLAGVSSQPVFPASFHGTLTIAGNLAAANTVVCGRIGGVDKGCLTTTASGQYGGLGGGVAKLTVSGDLADDGQTISFFVTPPGTVGGFATETVAFTPGDIQELNLSLSTVPVASSVTPTSTPDPTPTPTPAPSPTSTPVAAGEDTGDVAVAPATPEPTPVVVEPTVISEVIGAVSTDQESRIQTPDAQAELVVQPGSLPPELAGSTVEIELKTLDLATVPAPPSNTVFFRAIEINTLVDGQAGSITYTKPVVLSFPLTPDELALAGDDPSRLVVLRYNPATGAWETLPTTFQESPPPPHLEAAINTFSLFAVGVRQPVGPLPTATPVPVPAPTATPALVPTPTPVPVPVAGPTPTTLPTATLAPPSAATATPAPTVAATVTPPEEAPPAGFPVGAVIGIVLGVLVALGIVGGVIYYRRSRY